MGARWHHPKAADDQTERALRDQRRPHAELDTGVLVLLVRRRATDPRRGAELGTRLSECTKYSGGALGGGRGVPRWRRTTRMDVREYGIRLYTFSRRPRRAVGAPLPERWRMRERGGRRSRMKAGGGSRGRRAERQGEGGMRENYKREVGTGR
eukprot:2628623-Pyramimonas_sp.AAC.1